MTAHFSRRTAAALVALALQVASIVSWPIGAQAEQTDNACGPIYTRHFGPYDYRTGRAQLQVVDQYHFTPKVEALIAGESGYIGADLNYTLLASPNHHRALISATRLADKLKRQPEGLDYPIECYYERAIRYAPDDTIVRSLYAMFLDKRGRKTDALQQLDAARTFAKEDGFANYNVGLVYFELGAFDQALSQAWRARALGFERPDLQALLTKAGKWREEPPPSEVAAAASAASAAASGAVARPASSTPSASAASGGTPSAAASAP